jgi:hypothetical protein
MDARATAVRIAALVAFLVCLGLVVVGQLTVGWPFLLLLLGLYNRRFR